MQDVDATAKLVAAFGAAARSARSSEEFLDSLLRILIETLGANAGAIYLLDHSSVTMPLRKSAVALVTTSELTPCAWSNLSPEGAISIQFPPNVVTDAKSAIDLCIGTAKPNGNDQPTVFPMSATGELRGVVILYGIDRGESKSESVVTASLAEACTMLDLVTDRFLQHDLVELNKLSLSTVSADPSHFMCTLLSEVKKKLGCEGLSFFAKDPTEEVSTFWLIGTAPNRMSENPLYYSSEDLNFTARVLESRTCCVVHYDRIRRQDMVGLAAPRWRDVPADIETRSVLFAPVIKSGKSVGLLRCTNKSSPSPAVQFNAIDLRRADAFASLLMTWHIAAEKEHRFASSLSDVSHEIKTGAAGVKSAANFVKRELSKRLPLNIAEDLAQKLDHVAKAADSFIKVLPALRRASAPSVRSEQDKGFRPYADLCKPICELFRGQAVARSLKFQFVGQDQLGLIYAEIEDFRPVFQNLIANAVKYTLPHKEIFVRLQRPEDEYAAIHVLSESLPVRPDERESIFRFRYRSVAARASGTEGQGMGLAIARSKARELGGDLRFRTVNAMNVFSFLIPIRLFRQPEKQRT